MLKKIIGGFILIFLIIVASCHHHKNKNVKKTTIVVAALQSPVHQLYFTGSLSPINAQVIESPVSGVVTQLGFTYGDKISQNQTLFSIASHELADNYRKSISDYLQKKQVYETQKQAYSGENVLYQAGVVARNDYEASKAQYDNAALDFMQSKYALEKILKKVNIDPATIESLSLTDLDKIDTILQKHFQDVVVHSPANGVALYPQSKSSGDASGDGKLSIGSEVKEGQLLVSVGDLSGLSAQFNANEEDIVRIEKGMPVIVTGSAFSDVTLKGVVTAVAAQANQGNADNSGISMFAVGVSIPNINPAQMKRIRVGMTAKFEIDLQSKPKIVLPINAVSHDDGNATVLVIQKNGTKKKVPVTTGKTTPTDIVIESGISPGDKIQLPQDGA